MRPILRKLRNVRIMYDILEWSDRFCKEEGESVREIAVVEEGSRCGIEVARAHTTSRLPSGRSPFHATSGTGHDISMITRQSTACIRQISRSSTRRYRHGSFQRRKASTSTAMPATAPSPAAPLASITSELDKLTPRFDVSASSIEILKGPSEFYETLKVCS